MKWLFEILLGRLGDGDWKPSWTKISGYIQAFIADQWLKHSDFFATWDPESYLSPEMFSNLIMAAIIALWVGIAGKFDKLRPGLPELVETQPLSASHADR